MLMNSTGRYVYHRIGSVKGKEAYRLSMKACLEIMGASWTNVDIIKTKIDAIKEEGRLRYKPTMFNRFHDEISYHNMAVDNTLDIVNRLEARFITGTFDPEPRVYKHSIAYLKEGESGLFD